MLDEEIIRVVDPLSHQIRSELRRTAALRPELAGLFRGLERKPRTGEPEEPLEKA
jgi:hypothetical protein